MTPPSVYLKWAAGCAWRGACWLLVIAAIVVAALTLAEYREDAAFRRAHGAAGCHCDGGKK